MFVTVGEGEVLGVAEEVEKSKVAVGGIVDVAVNGNGEGNTWLVGVGTISDANSTDEMEIDPATNPMETRAITSALPRSRKPCINFSP